MDKIIDIGNKCVECHNSTSFGSGRFVNRISAETEKELGYLCADCQMMKCDKCKEKKMDFTFGHDNYWCLCDDCFDKGE